MQNYSNKFNQHIINHSNFLINQKITYQNQSAIITKIEPLIQNNQFIDLKITINYNNQIKKFALKTALNTNTLQLNNILLNQLTPIYNKITNINNKFNQLTNSLNKHKQLITPDYKNNPTHFLKYINNKQLIYSYKNSYYTYFKHQLFTLNKSLFSNIPQATQKNELAIIMLLHKIYEFQTQQITKAEAAKPSA